MYFYEILLAIMEEKSLTIPDVAKLTGLADSTVRSIISRKTKNVSLEVAFKMSNGLDVSLERLNGENEKKEDYKEITLNKDEKKLLHNFNKLNDLGRKEAHKRVDELTHISKYTVNKNNETSNQVLSLEEAREYLKSFSSAAYGGFNPDEMTDDQIIETATELKYQFETVTHKYKK